MTRPPLDSAVTSLFDGEIRSLAVTAQALVMSLDRYALEWPDPDQWLTLRNDADALKTQVDRMRCLCGDFKAHATGCPACARETP